MCTAYCVERAALGTHALSYILGAVVISMENEASVVVTATCVRMRSAGVRPGKMRL